MPKENHPIAYWQQAADDIVLYRKGLLSRDELSKRYPDLQCKEGWRHRDDIEDAVQYVIPGSCPLPQAARIIVQSEYEPSDKCLVDGRYIKRYYCPEWNRLPPEGNLNTICAQKRPLLFRAWVEKDYIDLRYLLEEGDHGDELGFGVEPDTWLVAHLNTDGTWRQRWYIEGKRYYF